MLDALGAVGNASSVHGEGSDARRRIEAARVDVARLVGGDAKLVTLTSGGTEANAAVLTPKWTLRGQPYETDLLLVGAPSMFRFSPAAAFRRSGCDRYPSTETASSGRMRSPGSSTRWRRRANGRWSPSCSPITKPASSSRLPCLPASRTRQAHRHCDAIKGAGRVPVDIASLGVDVLTLSAHKIGGPQGAGAIVRASEDLLFAPLLTGGGQERRLRGGTENVAAIAGFGVAAQAALADLDKAQLWSAWRDELASIMTSSGLAGTVFGAGVPRLPQTLCIALGGIPAETLVIALDLAGVAVSSGSACSSGKVAPSTCSRQWGFQRSSRNRRKGSTSPGKSKDSDLHLFATAWRRVLEPVARKHQAA